MRIFKFSKENNHDNGEGLFEVRITKDKEFKSVILTNPTDSNCIYIIDKITLLGKFNLNSAKYNEVRFYSYEDLKTTDSDYSYDSLKIKFKLHEMESADKLLLYKTNMGSESMNNLIEEDYFLVLPGGVLSIEFANGEKDVFFKLMGRKEVL